MGLPVTNIKLPRCSGLLSLLPEPANVKDGWPWTEGTVLSWSANVDWPRVTVVTPSYNQGAYIEETIRSVLLQNYPNLEYIIIDGGSDDQTLSIIKKYEPWITHWVSERDGGQAEAINKGFANATGELFAWINSDDYYLPHALIQLVKALMQSRADFVHGDVWRADEHDAPRPWRNGAAMDLKTTLESLYIPIPQQGAMWRRSLWKNVGGLDPQWHCVLDRDFFIRAALKHKFHYEPSAVAVSRVHPAAKSTAFSECWIQELPKMYKTFFLRTDLPDSIKDLRRQCIYRVWQGCAAIARSSSRSHIPYLIAAFFVSPARFIQDEIQYLFGSDAIDK
ncbi:MAG: glycosyltransferase [Candidatus Electrothrix sp. ATG1]|nr:glycosyltransferase [Candidatus Electrothrix sp. ATG1]